MSKALQYKIDFGGWNAEVMLRGSQMIVLTDAPSKQPELVDNVINDAITRGVCIHVFATEDYALNDRIYERITDETHGILHTQWDILQFAEAYSRDNCHYLEHELKKRQIRSIRVSRNYCEMFIVSKLAALLKLTIKGTSGTTTTLTFPNSTEHTLYFGTNNFVFFNQIYPDKGEWKACTTDVNIEMLYDITYAMDTTVLYFTNKSLSTLAPPSCKGQ